MRTGTITIDGAEHLLCFNARVIQKGIERFGSMEAFDKAIAGEGGDSQSLDNSIWILAAMMDAGHKYAIKKGIETGDPMSCDDIYDYVGLDDFAEIQRSIAQTISDGSSRTVEIETPKNEETTLVQQED